MAQQMKVTNTFRNKAKFSWPSDEKPGVFKVIEFDCRFVMADKEPTAVDALRKLEEEQGQYAFLSKVLLEVEYKQDLEFVDDEGQPISALEWTKRNQLAQIGASLAYWDVANRDIEAKNSKMSRGR